MSYGAYDESNPYYNDNNGSGGFLTNSQGGGFTDSSPSTRNKNEDTLRPVTIKQVLSASQPHSDFPFQIEGRDITHVSIVAVVRSASKQATSAVYSLEDGTGTLDVRYWMDSSGGESESTTDIQQNQYVRVIGALKSFHDKLQITAQVVKPITDFHEIFYHKAEALAVTLQIRKGTDTIMNESKPSATYSQEITSEPNYMRPYLAFPELHKSVMKAVFEEVDRSPQGVHVARIAQRCPKGDEALTEAIEYLISEGHLFTGEDDEHILPVSQDS